MPQSRLSRHKDLEGKKQIVYLLFGILIIIGLLLKFAPVIIDGIGSVVLSVSKDEESVKKRESLVLLTAPLIKSEFNATDSARISIDGLSSTDNGTIEVYVNGKVATKKDLTDKKFEIENLKLTDGENIIKAKHILNGKESNFSEDLAIIKTGDIVTIENLSPGNGQEFKKGDERIEISGKTDPLNTITVNGSRAIVDQNGNFSYIFQLKDGENEIRVVATSPTGKKNEEIITLKYTP